MWDEAVLETRAGLYALLHRLYTYPLTETVLEEITALRLEEEGAERAPSSSMLKGLTTVQARWKERGDQDGFLEELNVEYTRLFEGPGMPVAPPYASYYLNKGRLVGEETMRVRAFYLQWEVLPDPEVLGGRIPEDHIALEMGFMAYLNQVALKALKEGETLLASTALANQGEFLEKHLLSWVPSFCRQVLQNTREPLFQGLALFTQGYLEKDYNWLSGLF